MITRAPGTQTLSCKITLGPLTIETEASLDQVAALILQLVKEYRELPKVLKLQQRVGAKSS
jgi:hypothetical protein